MKTIKIGRTTYEIKPGDYIMDNGLCYQFCAGDNRCLKLWYSYKHTKLIIPKTVLKKIDLSKMKKVVSIYTYYYFQEETESA